MELTIADKNHAQGGPHSVQIGVAGEVKLAENAISWVDRNEVAQISISLSDLGFNKVCIRETDIDRIVLVANSNDGIDIAGIEFFASFYQSDLDTSVDGNGKPEYLEVLVF